LPASRIGALVGLPTRACLQAVVGVGGGGNLVLCAKRGAHSRIIWTRRVRKLVGAVVERSEGVSAEEDGG